MFPARYYARRMFAPRYFPEHGLTSITVYTRDHRYAMRTRVRRFATMARRRIYRVEE